MSNNNVNPQSSAQFIYITPENVFSDLTLSAHDLRMYMFISSFTFTRGHTYASNDFLAKKFNIDRSTVIRSINRLCKKQYIVREEINGHRYLRVPNGGIAQRHEEGVAGVPPPRRSPATPPSQPCDPIINKINIKKINNNNNNNAIINEKVDRELLEDRKKYLQADEFERTEKEFLKQCSHFLDNANKDKYPFQSRLKALKTIIKKGFFEKPAGYDKGKIVKSILTPDETVLLAKYQHGLRMSELGQNMGLWITEKEIKEVNKIIEKIKANEQAKPLKLKDILAKDIPR